MHFYLQAPNPKKTSNSVTELDGKLQELHDTLSRLRRESDEQVNKQQQNFLQKVRAYSIQIYHGQIQKLRRESEDATRTIERLQQQLQRQSDYETLKREIQ